MADGPKKHIAENLLHRAHSPDTAEAIFREKVKQRPLLLRPTSPVRAVDARSKRQHERRLKQNAQRKSKKPRPLSARQKRSLCLYEIPKEQQKFATYEPIHRMWSTYMREILNLHTGRSYVDAQGAGPILASADYHGALLEVTRSRCVSRVGLSGIVVKDAKFTFEIVTKSNALKRLPKENTIFKFAVAFPEDESHSPREDLVFEIHGSQFEARAPDRANKKFRLHLDQDV